MGAERYAPEHDYLGFEVFVRAEGEDGEIWIAQFVGEGYATRMTISKPTLWELRKTIREWWYEPCAAGK